MFFLLEYDRRKGKLVDIASFHNVDRTKAENQRLVLEMELHKLHVDREVVLLEASNEDALRRTHRRYFENARQIGQSVRKLGSSCFLYDIGVVLFTPFQLGLVTHMCFRD